ncbi:MAG: hypothetical protein DI628_08415 [Blastochloris viridis]|uniref:Uncharacterized protein n=1 Tax=Blastochloris viridis TaxID=1079 RepID=A0A6N4RCU8_BLAVI|nr:MAG: hypothetical protein DI628_08415 [Blastochloris viridis]
MKKAILGILMLASVPVGAYAQSVPEPYRADVILYRCSDTITSQTAHRIEASYYKINMGSRTLIRLSYIATAVGDKDRIKNYCDNLAKAAAKYIR